MEILTAANPTPENVHAMIPRGTAGSGASVASNMVTVRTPLSSTGGTATAGFVSWINPELYTIGVTDVVVHFHTTGTGTFDMGISDDGTGDANDLFNGGTMDTVVNKGIRSLAGGTGTAGVGATGTTLGAADVLFLGPGGTGTSNSIVAITSETATTARGDLYVTYFITNR